MKTPKKYRIISQLRKLLPRGNWRFLTNKVTGRKYYESPIYGTVVFHWEKTAFKDIQVREVTLINHEGIGRSVPIIYQDEVERLNA
jgi:hypothetical protein